MRPSERRTVITGLGAVTPLGTGNERVWKSLSAGRGGVMPIQSFPSDPAVTQLAAEVRDFDAKQFVKQRKSLKVMARDIQLSVGAAELAMQDSKLQLGEIDPTRFGVSFGAGLIASELDELGAAVDQSVNGTRKFDIQKWGKSGMSHLFPLWMLKYLPNMPACHISIIYNAQGPNNSITAAEASSALAIGEAHRIIARGDADLFLAGGADSKIHPLSIVKLALVSDLSRRADEPERACRPFDRDRDGLVPGEGSGVLVLEERDRAKARKARVYGEVLGFGAACNPKDHQRAILSATRRALADAGLKPADLGHVIAHGSGQKVADANEAKALAELLGPAAENVPVVAYKGYWGHMGAGGGGLELIASLLGLAEGKLPATLNFDAPDLDAPKLWILRDKIDYPDKPLLTYDLSHVGQCAALVVGPPAD